jgi:multiple antibiotic resistance protein
VSFDPSAFGHLFVQAFILLFAVLDPLGNVPFFQALTSNMEKPLKLNVARNSTLIALTLLLVFAFAGYSILEFLNITIIDFMIAGGILLLILSIRDIVEEKPVGVSPQVKSEHVSAFPLGTPLMAGPGSITTVMLIVRFDYGFILAPAVIIANCLVAYMAFRLSEGLLRVMGSSGMGIVAKVMDILMAAIAVSFITTGLLKVF